MFRQKQSSVSDSEESILEYQDPQESWRTLFSWLVSPLLAGYRRLSQVSWCKRRR